MRKVKFSKNPVSHPIYKKQEQSILKEKHLTSRKIYRTY